MSLPVRNRVLVVGDVMTDVIVVPEGPLVHGSDRRAAIRMKPGGSGANQAVWLGSMGTNVSFVARVGAADKGHLEAYFRGFHVDPLLIADANASSGVLVTLVDTTGERSFLTDRGANLRLSPSDMPVAMLEEIAVLMVSGYSYFAEGPRLAVTWLANEAAKRAVARIIDAASVGFIEEVGAKSFIDWTGDAALLFVNRNEAFALSGMDDLDAQMQSLGRHYRRVAIKLGADGAAVGDRNGVRLALPAPAVNVVDTTGAGDAFAAAFVSAELRGQDEADALALGIAAGSAAVRRIGGQPG